MFIAVVFYILLIIEGEAWNVKAMNLRTGSGCFRVCRWNSSTQSELVTSSDHVHHWDVRQISYLFSYPS